MGESYKDIPVQLREQYEAEYTFPSQGLEEASSLPSISHFTGNWMEQIPEQEPELIRGILRRGEKLILQAPSKAGKSFLLMNLATSLTHGLDWVGYQCNRSKVLYCNFELNSANCIRRMGEIYKARNLIGYQGFDILNLRGDKNVSPVSEFAEKLIQKIDGQDYSVIILDPAYKMIEGDENSAEFVSSFTRCIDRIAEAQNVAVIYAHHHSKGAHNYKSAMNRGSGSGVFSRDADAIIDLSELEPSDCGEELKPSQSAWRMEHTLRDFPNPGARDIIFDFPLFIVTDALKDAKPKYGADSRTNSERGNRERATRKADNVNLLSNIVRMEQNGLSILDAIDCFSKNGRSVTEKTIRNYVNEPGSNMIIKNRVIYPI